MTAGLLALVCAAQAEPYLSPPEERRAFVVADGFEATLFASEPMIANPVQMAFDERGRVWVACAQAFPQLEAGKRPSDTLVVLEDADGDGRADKHTVFADDLLVPTGVELGDGGAYVASQPHLLFLKDTDGDGKADLRRVLFSGFGTEDNHHAINSFVWGPGGGLYFQSGIFLHSAIETPRGPLRIDAVPVVFELRTRTMELRPYARSREFVNMWGHAFDRWGQDILSDASSGNHFLLAPAIGEAIAPAGYPRMPTPRVSCGIAFASGGHLPPEMRGHLLVNNVTKKSVSLYRVADDGAGFSLSEVQPPILQSREDCFRPVDIAMGPDGAIWVLDFYNLIVGQMTYNFRDPRRGHSHGRLWRITAKGRPLLAPPRLAGAPVPELLEQLKSPYDYAREKARRALAERDAKEVGPALARWVSGLDPADPEREHHRLEALWACQAIDAPEPRLLRELLGATDPRARAAAVRVLSAWHSRVEGAVDLLAERVGDDHPRVRLEAVAALGRLSGTRPFELALRALDRPVDRHLEFALRTAAVARQEDWIPALEAGRLDLAGREKGFALALQAVEAGRAVRPLLGLLRSGKVRGGELEQVLVLVAGLGAPADLAEVLARPDADLTAPVLAALAGAARDRNVRPPADPERMRRLLDASDEAARLAGAWKLDALRPEIARRAGAGSRAALEALADLGDAELLAGLAREGPRARRVAAAGALASLRPVDAAKIAVELWRADAADTAGLFAPFLQRKGGSEALAAALGGAAIPADAAKLALRYLYSAGREEPALVALLKPAAAIETAARELSPEEMKRLLADVREKGDPARGEQVFRRKELSCLKCHGVGGAGGDTGPDLATVGSSFPADYLVESLLVPNKMIKEGYTAMLVATKGGEIVSGVRVRQTDREIVLRDPERGDRAIPLAAIEQKKETGSIMPAGLPDLLTRAELLDLVRFLSELGRPGPYAVPDLPVVRRWRVKEGEAWVPAYSEVSGTLPAAALGAELRFEIEVTTAGRVGLRIDPPDGVAGPPELDLAAGTHAVTLRVDRARRGERGLRVELLEVPGSAARARIVGGP